MNAEATAPINDPLDETNVTITSDVASVTPRASRIKGSVDIGMKKLEGTFEVVFLNVFFTNDSPNKKSNRINLGLTRFRHKTAKCVGV
jgi:hypothetical protein